MSNLGIITVGRSDFSILHPLMLHLENQGLAFKIFASTAHFSKEFGHTANEIFQSFDSKNIESVDAP